MALAAAMAGGRALVPGTTAVWAGLHRRGAKPRFQTDRVQEILASHARNRLLRRSGHVFEADGAISLWLTIRLC